MVSSKSIWGVILLVVSAFGQETLEQRIETVFGTAQPTNSNGTFGPGFDVIVQPDPIVEVGNV